MTSTILSLLVAFISVAVVGLPQLLEALQPERGRLAITFRSNSADRVSLIVYNTGNVAAALDGFAELHVPTEYLPVPDDFVTDVFVELLPYDRIDLELAIGSNDNALIEAGASRHFELAANPVEPWRWRFDTTVTTKHEIDIVGEYDQAELDAWLEEIDYQAETSVNTVTELLVTPLEPRIWPAKSDDQFCRLNMASIDVSGARQNHDLAISCRRVSDLIGMLPSRVRIESNRVNGVDSEFVPARSFDHQLVVNGEPSDSSKVNVNVINSSQIGVDPELEDLFDDDDLF